MDQRIIIGVIDTYGLHLSRPFCTYLSVFQMLIVSVLLSQCPSVMVNGLWHCIILRDVQCRQFDVVSGCCGLNCTGNGYACIITASSTALLNNE